MSELWRYLAFILFAVLYGALLMLWGVSWQWRRRRLHQPASMAANPAAWLAYWLPNFLALQVNILLLISIWGFGLPVLLFPHRNPAIAHRYSIAVGVFLVGWAAFSAASDVAMVVRARHLARRQADAR
jgi:hypothetical protein